MSDHDTEVQSVVRFRAVCSCGWEHLTRDPREAATASDLHRHQPDAVRVGPPDGEPICWACEGPIPAGEGRNKGGWLVHPPCPPPEHVGLDEGQTDG